MNGGDINELRVRLPRSILCDAKRQNGILIL